VEDVAVPAFGVIVPHAGYVYSGLTAAHVYARVVVPAVVVVLAPNHTGLGRSRPGGSVYALGALRTPAGDVAVQEQLAAGLVAQCDLLEDDPLAHEREHAVEVHLPFLLARRPDVRVVPIIVGWTDWPRTRQLAEALAAAVTAVKDGLALEQVERMDAERLLAVTAQHRVTMCGRVPAAAVLHAARLLGATRAEVVHRSHSGSVTGDEDRVVSYAGVIVR
jgi:predicted class III extradiol MEMO1 family dioxygenase